LSSFIANKVLSKADYIFNSNYRILETSVVHALVLSTQPERFDPSRGSEEEQEAGEGAMGVREVGHLHDMVAVVLRRAVVTLTLTTDALYAVKGDTTRTIVQSRVAVVVVGVAPQVEADAEGMYFLLGR